MKKHSGTWNLQFGNELIKVSLSNGKATVGGKTIHLIETDNLKYPTSAGWMKFNVGPLDYFIHFNPFQIVAFKGGVEITGTVIKEIPSHGKFQCCCMYLMS